MVRIALIVSILAFVTTAEAKARKKRSPTAQKAEAAPAPPVAPAPASAEAEVVVVQAAPPPVLRVDPPPPRRPLGFVLAANVSGGAAFGGPQVASVGAGIELGYRAPFLRRAFGVSLTAAFARVFMQDATIAYGLALSPLVSLHLQKDDDIGRLQLGPSLRYMRIASAEGAESTWSMGGVVNVSYLRGFGKGGQLGATLSYAITPYFANDVLHLGHTVSVGATYVFEL